MVAVYNKFTFFIGVMDISVSHLNNRLTFQLPQELPLGLVFVTGTVSFSDSSAFKELVAHGRYKHLHFELLDDKYRMRCILVVRAMVDYELEYGVRVRVGGHLRFDPQRADYYLLARDLQRLDEDLIGEPEEDEIDQEEVASLLADIRKRTNQHNASPDLSQPELPQWVQNLEPDAIQENNFKQPQAVADEPNETDATAVIDHQATPTSDEALASSISALLDEVEDVELTPDVIESLEMKDEALKRDAAMPLVERGEDAVPDVLVPQSAQGSSNDQSWLLWLLVGVMGVILFVIVILLFFAI